MTNKIKLTEKYLVYNGSIQLVAEFYYSYSNSARVIYEVVRVKDSIPIFLEYHLDRLFNSIKLLKLLGPNRNSLISNIKELLLKNPVIENNIRVSLVYDMSALPNLIIYFIPSTYPTYDQRENGIEVKTLDANRTNPNIKVENSELREQVDKIISDTGCFEVLLINQDGFITEGSRSNIFFIKNDTLYTPPLEMVLGGITRQVLINISNSQGISLKVEPIPEGSLSQFDGAILTGTSPGFLPIALIDEEHYNNNHPLIKLLVSSYNDSIQNDIETWM